RQPVVPDEAIQPHVRGQIRLARPTSKTSAALRRLRSCAFSLSAAREFAHHLSARIEKFQRPLFRFGVEIIMYHRAVRWICTDCSGGGERKPAAARLPVSVLGFE